MEGSAKKATIRAGSSKPKKKVAGDTSPDGGGTPSRPRVALPSSQQEPTYYIGGGNGNAIIEEVMNGMGWKRIRDKTDESVRLRWCEVKSGINYNTFREGEQMVNRIPNGSLLTNKLGLLNSLQDYARISNTIQKRPVKLDFLPETYRLDDPKDRETFSDVFKENEIWICKPTGRNQGKGIFLVRSLDDLNKAVTEQEEANQQSQQLGKPQKPMNRIIQRYIMNPLLLDGRKFDIRCYMLVASTVPLLVLYHRGYCRLSMYEYDNSCENIIAHLTNQFIQKRDPQYAAVKEETAWSMDRFNDYINEQVAPQKGLEKDWVYGHLTKTMKQIMVHCVNAVKNKLQCKVGYFDMFGFDFLIDDDMKIWLIEVNVNPCLATNCEALRERVPGVIRETLYLAIECFEKAKRGRPLMPLQSQKEFELIFDGSGKGSVGSKADNSGGGTTSPTRATATASRQSAAQSPVRRARSLSPVKEATRGGGADQPKGKPSATASTTTPKTAAANSDKKSPKPSTEDRTSDLDCATPAESDTADTAAANGTNVKRSKRNKTAVDEPRNDDSEDGGDKVDKSPAIERNKLRQKPAATPLASESRSTYGGGKSLPYLAKPGVAKLSASNTAKEPLPRKKKSSGTGGVELIDESSKANRGS